VMAGVELLPTMATELVGLSLVGMLKPNPRGDGGFADMAVCKLLRNCCLLSTPDGCPWSDWRRMGAVTVSDAKGRSIWLELCLADDAERADGRCTLLADGELP
jgi:hypothetical protein